MTFALFTRSHDPDEQSFCTFKFKLAPGLAIASGATVVCVDSTGTTPDLASTLVIQSVVAGQIDGQLWGVTAWIHGGTTGTMYSLRCSITDTAAPIANKADLTMRLRCEQH